MTSGHPGLAQRLDAEWDHLTARLRHQASSAPSQESTMTTPQQSVVDSLHAITGELAANPLISRLVQYGIGKRLTAAQADHMVTVIADLEQASQVLTYGPPADGGQVPQFTPHDDSAQQAAQ